MPSSFPSPLNIGIVLFPNVTQLDVTGPHEVLARMPATQVHLVAATLTAVRSEHGLTIQPDVTFEAAPTLDVICVPGGVGVNLAMEDEALLRFLRDQAQRARYVTSVCTGALILGAAGLLQGYRATTHWLSMDLLRLFGADPVEERIVVDRNRITGAGVTAGIDFGLVVASALFDAAAAQEIQLMIEYNPAPAYRSGSPSAAPADLVERAIRASQRIQSDRRIVAERAAALLEVNARGSGRGAVRSAERRSQTFEEAEGIAIDSLEPGTTLAVTTRNSQYRFVTLLDPCLMLAKGGELFPDPTIVRLEGATDTGRSKIGWILVGFPMDMWLGPVRIRSSRVRAVSIEGLPGRALSDVGARA